MTSIESMNINEFRNVIVSYLLDKEDHQLKKQSQLQIQSIKK